MCSAAIAIALIEGVFHMGLLMALMVLAVVGNIWVVVKIWRVSVPYAIVSFIFFPAAIFFMFAHWGNEEHDIKVPFVLTLVFSILFVLQAKKTQVQVEEDTEAAMRSPTVVVVTPACKIRFIGSVAAG